MTHALRLLKLACGIWACSVLQHRAGLSAGVFVGYCTARSSIRCPPQLLASQHQRGGRLILRGNNHSGEDVGHAIQLPKKQRPAIAG